MAVDAGDDRIDGWQFDVVVGMDVGLVGRLECMTGGTRPVDGAHDNHALGASLCS
jgi:hypothetical protein